MKKQFLILSLIVGLFLVVCGRVAMVAQDVNPPTHNGDVLIEGDATDSNGTSQEATFKITQPQRNAPYRFENNNGEIKEYKDAIPLLVEGKMDSTTTETEDLNTILVIRSHGGRESELRFDSGASYEGPDPTDISSMNAFIYTRANDHILRLAPGQFSGNVLGEVRLRKFDSSNNIDLQIGAQTESDASLTFLKGSIADAPFNDPGSYAAKIYRPAAPYENELRIAVADENDVLQDRMVIDSNGNVGVGTSTPAYPLHIVTTDESTALRLEPTINTVTVLNNYAAYYKMTPADTALKGGSFTAFSGTVTKLQGAENNISLNSSTISTINRAVGSEVELRRTSGNTANHTITDYYGFHSFGNAGQGSGNIGGTDWRHAYFEDFPNFGGTEPTVTYVSGLWIDQQTRGTNNYGIVLNGNGSIGNYGAAIALGASQNAYIYGKTDGIYVYDGIAETKISPHDPKTGEWIFYSKNVKTGRVLRVNMEELVRDMEKLTGKKYLVETFVESK